MDYNSIWLDEDGTGVISFPRCDMDSVEYVPAIPVRSELATLRAENERLRGKIEEIVTALDGEPEYHYQGMGCGLEDRNITDRYDAMEYGWEQAMDRIYSEHINHALDLAKEALK